MNFQQQKFFSCEISCLLKDERERERERERDIKESDSERENRDKEREIRVDRQTDDR